MPRRPLFVGLTALGTLVCITLGAEALLRVWKPQAVGVSRLPAIYEPDSVIGFRYRPGASGHIQRLFDLSNTVSINSMGFHDEDWDLEGGPAPVIVLGDSFTAALHVPIRRTWTQVLQSRLRRAWDPRLRVLNLGIDGTGSDVQLAIFERTLERVTPRLAIVAFFSNDLHDVQRGLTHREVNAGYVLQFQDPQQAVKMRSLAQKIRNRRASWWLFEHAYLYRLLRFLTDGDRNLFRTNLIGPAHIGAARGSGVPGPPLREIFSRFRQHAVAGIDLIVVPVPGRKDPEESLRTFRHHAAVPGLEIIDILPLLRAATAERGIVWGELYWSHDGHLNELGNELFGNAVAAALLSRAQP